MGQEWDTLVAVGALVLAGLTFLSKMFDKSLSIREHDEYRKGVERTTDGLQEQFRRELDKVESRLGLMDQAKPSTAQLHDAIGYIKEQVQELKNEVHKRLKGD